MYAIIIFITDRDFTFHPDEKGFIKIFPTLEEADRKADELEAEWEEAEGEGGGYGTRVVSLEGVTHK